MSTLHPGKGYKPVRLDDVPTGTNYTIASGYKGKDPIVIVPARHLQAMTMAGSEYERLKA